MADTALLKIDSMAVGYGEGPDVLRDVSLTVGEGEFVSVLGPSGCGKSTILNAVAGLLPVRAGTIEFRGKVVGAVNTDVGYMTQGDTLLPWRTTFDNVALPLRMRKVGRTETQERVRAMLAMLGLDEQAAGRFPSQLSGGMKRRTLLARSMIYEPALLLMDEPFGALDAQLREELQQELLDSVGRTGQAVVFITHDIGEAVLLSDEVVVVGGKPGEIIEQVTVPFEKRRNLEILRFSEEYIALTRKLNDVLHQARTGWVAEAATTKIEA